MNKSLIILALIILTGGILSLWYQGKTKTNNTNNTPTITSFDDCADAGYPVMESYPRRCAVPNGSTFIEDIGDVLDKHDLVRVENIQPGNEITSPIIIEGEARGPWFFEGSFSIKILDENDSVIGEGVAEAEDSWMTEEFVPFEATIEFNATGISRGNILLEKANTSGLAEHDDIFRIPVKFAS